MKKTKFSTKLLFSISIILISTSVISILLLLTFMGLLTKLTISYTKGASLLNSYTQAYITLKYSKISMEKIDLLQLEEKIKGFYIFYEILNGKDLPLDVVENNWLKFGMEKDEIRLVIMGTKLMRNTELMSPIKEISEKVKSNLDNIDNLSQKDLEDLIQNLIEFTNSFYHILGTITSTITSIVSLVFLLVIVVLAIYFLRTYYLITDLRNLTYKLPTIARSLAKDEIKELDIIDSKSELYPIQESLLTVIEKNQRLQKIKDDLKNAIDQSSKKLSEEVSRLRKFMSNVSELKSKLNEIDISSTLNHLEMLKQTFSALDSDIKDTRNEIEKVRTISTKVLEPISTIYEILEEAFRHYTLSKEIIFKYIDETKNVVETIQTSFSKSTEGIEDVLEELKRTSISLRSIGINASIEFSKISSASEALSNIANKIIELSRSLGTIFGNISSNLENLETELNTSISKIKTFIESFSEISKDIEEVGKTIQNIKEEKDKNLEQINIAYTSVGEIANQLQKLDKQNEKLLTLFISFTEAIKQEIEFSKMMANTTEELERYSECTNNIIEIVETLEKFNNEIDRI